MLDSVKNLECIKCYSSSRPRPAKSLSSLSETTVRRSAVDQGDLKSYWKKGHNSLGDQQSYHLQVFQRLY